MKSDAMRVALQAKPYALQRSEGPRLQAGKAPVFIMASSEQTHGAFNLFDVSCPPGYATALHIHYAEDVAVYVLEGTLTFFWGDEKKAAVAGFYFFQPRGTPHGFRVEGVTLARILYLTSPAGLDRFVIEQEQLAPNLESAAAAARYKIEVLGLLPE